MLLPDFRTCSNCGEKKNLLESFGQFKPKGRQVITFRKRCKKCIVEDQAEKRHAQRNFSKGFSQKTTSAGILLIKGTYNVAL
jgi:hypothetical protein